MNCECFKTSRIDGVGFWGELFTGVGNFLGSAIPVVTPVVGAVLPALLQPSAPAGQNTGGRLEPATQTVRQEQGMNSTHLLIGAAAAAAVLYLVLRRRK